MTKIQCPKCKIEIEIEENAKSVTCSQCGKEIAIVRTERELADAVKEEKDYIHIEGDLGKKTVKIKATGAIAWAIAIAAIAIAVAILLASGGAGAPAGGIIGIGAITVLGLPAAMTAVSIAVAAGGVGILTTLRDNYKIVTQKENIVILQKK